MADRRNVSAGTGPGGGHENALLARIGLPTALFWGFVGTLVFMIGDGVESAYLSPFLVRRGLVEHDVAVLVTVYGVAAAISSWLSGALADVIGPRRPSGVVPAHANAAHASAGYSARYAQNANTAAAASGAASSP